MKPLSTLLLALVVSAGGAAGCGTTPNEANGDAGKSPLVTAEGGAAFITVGTGGDAGGDGSLLGPQGPLTIMPTTPVVTVVTGTAPPSVTFTAYIGGTLTGAAWSLDRGELGAIDSVTGIFTPTGTIAGTGTITAAYGTEMMTTTVTVQISTTQQGDPAWSATPAAPGAGGYGGVGGDGPGSVPIAAQVTTLNGTPTADTSVSLLYPYDGTVWPQGLLAPLLQWQSGTHAFDSVYLDLKEKNYEYKGYFSANKMPFTNLPIPQAAWDAMTFSNGGEGVTVSLVFGQGASAFGPYTETWHIAQATMQGTIYYNSYGTALVKNSGTDGLDSYGHQYGAGTLAIAPGATSPTLAAGIDSINTAGNGTGCRVCHTVSADGKSLLTQASNTSASDYSNSVFVDLAMDTTAGAGTSLATANLAFPALYRDGSLLFSSAGGMINGDSTSRLYSVPAGTLVAGVTGVPSGLQAALPAFSPDGHHLSFDFWGGSLMTGTTTVNGDQKSLAVLDFDGTSAFSNPRVLYTPPSGTSVTYSSFLPTSAGVVFELELTNPSNSWGFTWSQNTGELWWLDLASGTAHRLDQLNGYAAGGAVYLPDNTYAGGSATHTAAQDATLNYEPTVNPITSGGYSWVVFTSRRMYGNVAQLGPWVSDPRHYPWLDQITDKKLWVGAVDLNGSPGTDPSHPPFYLPAQEIHAGNARGYWTVEACRANGQSCQTGDQCCGGYCQPGEASLVCSSQMPSCSADYDKCTKTSDCCGASQGIVCINDICSLSQPAPP